MAVNETEYVPSAVGVPEMVALAALNDRPGGREPDMAQV